MYYIFIINDLKIGYKSISAENIIKSLYENKIWLFLPTAPLIKNLQEGDEVIIYIAGKDRRYFHSTFKIKNSIKKIDNAFNNIDFINYFKFYIKITDITLYKNKLNIKDIKEDLLFIKDKKIMVCF